MVVAAAASAVALCDWGQSAGVRLRTGGRRTGWLWLGCQYSRRSTSEEQFGAKLIALERRSARNITRGAARATTRRGADQSETSTTAPGGMEWLSRCLDRTWSPCFSRADSVESSLEHLCLECCTSVLWIGLKREEEFSETKCNEWRPPKWRWFRTFPFPHLCEANGKLRFLNVYNGVERDIYNSHILTDFG